jgi:putative membrane protein
MSLTIYRNTMLFSKYTFRALSLALCLGLVTSCAKREDTDVTTENDTTVTVNGSDTRMPDTTHNMGGNATHGGMNMASMNDGNILAVMSMADSMEIAMANMAKTKAQHPGVKKFAQKMVTEHAKMKKEGQAVAQKQNITPMMPSGEIMNADMMTMHSAMQSASGHAFDSLYIGSQVAMHQHVLDNLNSANPQDTAIRGLIDKAKVHVQQHLEEAKKVQTAFHNRH